MIGPSRMPSLLSFLFNLAWASRVRLPLLIAVAFMVTNIHMRLEININFEMDEQIVVHQEALENSDDSSDEDEDDDDEDDDDDEGMHWANNIYCTDDELFFTDEESSEEDDNKSENDKTINKNSVVGDSNMQNKNEVKYVLLPNHPVDTTDEVQQSLNTLPQTNDLCKKSNGVER